MKPQSEILAEVHALADSGEGIVRVEGDAVFVAGVLPGERVRIRLPSSRRERATLVAVESASAERVVAPCAIVDRCGGCTWQHASARLQREARLARMRRALPPSLREIPIEYVASAEDYHYRSRARLAFEQREGRTELGFRARGSHRIVDLAQCVVLVPALNEALPVLRERLAILKCGGEVSIALGTNGRPVASVRPAEGVAEKGFQLPTRLVDAGFAGAALWAPGATAPTVAGDPRPVVRGGDGAPLWLAAEGFSQANEGLNAQLASAVAEDARSAGREVLELFAGAGNFTVLLARDARRVVAIELDRGASAALAANVADRGLTNVAAMAEDAVAAASSRRADVVVLDPPRTGAREVCEQLVRRPPRTLVYVSCDAPTLGRDLGILQASMAVKRIRAFEMFPQTPHLEMVAMLERRSARAR